MNRPSAIGILKGFALTALFLLAAPYANATYVQYDAAGNLVGTMTDARRESFVRAYGVLDQTTGQVVVKGTQVPVSVGAQVSKGSIAKAAAKIGAKAIPGVQTALALKELCDLLCPGNNYRLAPDGASLQMPEKSDVPGDAPGTGYYINSQPQIKDKSALAVCNAYAAAQVPTVYPTSTGYGALSTWQGGLGCAIYQKRNDGYTALWTTVGMSRALNFYVPDYILATEVQTEADVLARAEQQAKFKPLYDAIMADRAANPTTWPADYNPVKATTPVEVTAPPVSSPERVVSTITKPGANGSTDTTTTTEKTVVTPTTTGSTVGDSQTTFPTQTVTTNTTVNNVTNNTTTETTTVNHPADTTTPTTPGETDNSPRECGTPGRPKCQIDETGTPEGKTVYQTESTKVDTAFEDMQTKLTTITNPDGKDTSWGWSPTSWFSAGQCEPFDFGEMPTLNMNLAFDVCPHLQKAQELLSFMWVLSTIGVILAMVWETMNSQGA